MLKVHESNVNAHVRLYLYVCKIIHFYFWLTLLNTDVHTSCRYYHLFIFLGTYFGRQVFNTYSVSSDLFVLPTHSRLLIAIKMFCQKFKIGRTSQRFKVACAYRNSVWVIGTEIILNVLLRQMPWYLRPYIDSQHILSIVDE